MGLLDDAIRQHLELKRQHGAPEEELQRQEEEALGPARRDVAPAGGDGEVELEDAADEAAETAPAEELAGADEAAEAAPAPHEQETILQEQPGEPTPAPEPAPPSEPMPEPIPGPEPSEPTPEPEPVVESDSAADHGPLAESDSAPDLEPLAEEAASGPYDVAADTPGFEREEEESASAEDPFDEQAAPDEEDLLAEDDEEHPPESGDDVLEDTPDFLQETPEHDRLWFEQKPPRDFDFD
jgi:hypothetical protein